MDTEQFIISSLKEDYANVCYFKEDGDDELLRALDVVLKFYMFTDDYEKWEQEKLTSKRYQWTIS